MPKSEIKLKKVDPSVQDNQQGSGISDKKVTFKIIEAVLPQDNKAQKAMLLFVVKFEAQEVVFKVVAIIAVLKLKKVLIKIEELKFKIKFVAVVLMPDSLQSLSDTVSSEVESVKEQQPHVKCLCTYCPSVVLITCDKGVRHKDERCKKAECTGNSNHFDEVCCKQTHGNPCSTALTNCDGLSHEASASELLG